MTAQMTGPGDLRDQHWLDGRIAAIEDGVDAVIDIARNWSDGRNLARLHPGVSAAAYITEHVGVLGKSVVPVLLAESDWSNRQIAAVAGVDESTVRAQLRDFPQLDRPAETLGADGKYRPRVVQAVVIDEPMEAPRVPEQPDIRVTMAAFERDIRRIREAYEPFVGNPRFAKKYSQVMTAIGAVLEG